MNSGTRETTWAGGRCPRERMSLAVVPVLTFLLVAVLTAGPAGAVPYVFFEPGLATVEPGDAVELSFRVGACGDTISGYQLYISFDPAVVELVSVTEGSLYVYSGFSTWFIPEEEGPGSWHFFDTVMGAGTYVLPPGELVHLEFQALDYGSTEIHIDSILLADINRENLPVGGYEHAHIFVVPLTGVEEGGGIAAAGPAHPNPFRSVTAVPLSVPVGEDCATVRIYDVSGRLVRRMTATPATPGNEVVWDGRDDRGQEVPCSVYFFELSTEASTARCRLVKIE